MSNHTQGPWIYKATAGNHDFAVYPESTGQDVALVRNFNEANAALIAAAPELLEACINAEGVLSEPGIMDVDSWKEWSRQTGAALRAAIAKARGE